MLEIVREIRWLFVSEVMENVVQVMESHQISIRKISRNHGPQFFEFARYK